MKGNRRQKPKDINEHQFEIVVKSWNQNPLDRIKIDDLVSLLDEEYLKLQN